MYVAWALVFILSTGSATVVVLYGIQFKNVKSLQWLFSSCVSLVQDVLITQPLKVLAIIELRRRHWLGETITLHARYAINN